MNNMRKIQLSVCLSALIFLVAACDPVWLSASQRYEREADTLLASDRSSEALLAYYQAWTADPSNHSALKKLIPLYLQQGRDRQAEYFSKMLTGPEQTGMNGKTADGTPGSMAGLEFAWMAVPVNTEPVGLAADADNAMVAYGSGQAALLNSRDGSAVWSQTIGQALSAPPVLTDDLVLLGSESGKLTALSRVTGEQRWSTDLPGAIYGEPEVYGGIAYTGSFGGKITAIDLKTGAINWQTAVDSPVVAQPLAADDTIYAGTTGGKLWALNRSTGKPLWDKPANLTGSLEGKPALSENMLFVGGNDSRLYALALNGREYYWQYSTSDSIYASPLVDGSRVYVFSIGQTAAAVDRNTGTVVWQQDLPAPVRQTPVLKGSTLYFAGLAQPFLYQMDSATGRVTGQVDTGDWIESGPVMAGGQLLLAGKDGAVIAYRVN
jgi:outer membrane protein assembly factor BamB